MSSVVAFEFPVQSSARNAEKIGPVAAIPTLGGLRQERTHTVGDHRCTRPNIVEDLLPAKIRSIFIQREWCMWRGTDFPRISNSPHTGRIEFLTDQTMLHLIASSLRFCSAWKGSSEG